VGDDTWMNHEKYGQKIHLDYGNNMLTYPSVERPDAVACILYYSDAELCGGSTRVCHKPHNSRLTTAHRD
jgi:hypothetical protein